jgi:hypothetical protein
MIIGDILDAAKAANPSAELTIKDTDDGGFTCVWRWHSRDNKKRLCFCRTVSYSDLPYHSTIFDECKDKMNNSV